MHYNTTNESGQMLISFSEKAQSQESIIYEFFKQNKGVGYTWSELKEFFHEMNEISLKRSMSDLKNEGKLIKTDEKGMSKYNRPAYKYKFLA